MDMLQHTIWVVISILVVSLGLTLYIIYSLILKYEQQRNKLIEDKEKLVQKFHQGKHTLMQKHQQEKDALMEKHQQEKDKLSEEVMQNYKKQKDFEFEASKLKNSLEKSKLEERPSKYSRIDMYSEPKEKTRLLGKCGICSFRRIWANPL
jgi:hypothetical protein